MGSLNSKYPKLNDWLSFRFVPHFVLNFEVSPLNDLGENPAKCPLLFFSPYSVSDWLPHVGEFPTLKISHIFALLYLFLWTTRWLLGILWFHFLNFLVSNMEKLYGIPCSALCSFTQVGQTWRPAKGGPDVLRSRLELFGLTWELIYRMWLTKHSILLFVFVISLTSISFVWI